jgi:UDP-N-acetylglucosamine--N-acetylmuramyl-(pentapeptide) pyrophosphoryl-undecaprenol N-acetylglucosamine transferase
MRILFTCGGTAGHINPAIAVARTFQEKHPEAEVLFVGADGEMETRLVPREGFKIRTVNVRGFYRKFNLGSLKFNLKTLQRLFISHRQAEQILDEFQPDLVMGTGGYASYPVVRRAAQRGIPALIHESNAVPGLTTRVLSRSADRVMVNFEESRSRYVTRTGWW